MFTILMDFSYIVSVLSLQIESAFHGQLYFGIISEL